MYFKYLMNFIYLFMHVMNNGQSSLILKTGNFCLVTKYQQSFSTLISLTFFFCLSFLLILFPYRFLSPSLFLPFSSTHSLSFMFSSDSFYCLFLSFLVCFLLLSLFQFLSFFCLFLYSYLFFSFFFVTPFSFLLSLLYLILIP